jgi:hypothetical protein
MTHHIPFGRAGLVALAALAVASAASLARADGDDALDISVSAGTVTVTTKGDWHINNLYPWSLVGPSITLDKTKFVLGDKTAVVAGAPQGLDSVHGGVCLADRCRSFRKDVTVP